MEDSDIPAAKPAPVQTLISPAKEKDLLIENYLPNLSNYQKVIKRIQITDDKYQKIEKPYILSPNVNFTDQKDYYIFYNDNLKLLIDLFKDELKEYLKEHNVILYYKKNNLNDIIKEIGSDLNADYSYNPIKLVSNFIAYNWYQETIDHANLLANNLKSLTSIVNTYSDKITENNFCSVTISEKLFDEAVNFQIYCNNSKNRSCLIYMKEIKDIKEKDLNDIEKLKLMNKKIDEFKKVIKPENSIDNIKEFCFVLNQISEYVKNFERSLQTKELDLLKVMDPIRRKLNYYLLEFRYKFVENLAPILNIKINRYKILCESLERTAVYLEKGEAKTFMKNLREELDKKAKNIDSFYQFQEIEIKDIISIAKQINFNKYEDLIEGYENKINDYQDQLTAKNREFLTFTAKETLKLAFNAYTGLNFVDNGITKNIPLNKIEQFIISDNAIKESENNTNKGEELNKNEIIEDRSQKILEKRRENLNSIGIKANEMGNDIIDKISKSFEMYQDMTKIDRNIGKCQRMKQKLQEKYNYNYDFFNALKLYCLIDKKNIEKDDYIGIMLEENNKEKANELREYSVYKLTDLRNE